MSEERDQEDRRRSVESYAKLLLESEWAKDYLERVVLEVLAELYETPDMMGAMLHAPTSGKLTVNRMRVRLHQMLMAKKMAPDTPAEDSEPDAGERIRAASQVLFRQLQKAVRELVERGEVLRGLANTPEGWRSGHIEAVRDAFDVALAKVKSLLPAEKTEVADPDSGVTEFMRGRQGSCLTATEVVMKQDKDLREAAEAVVKTARPVRVVYHPNTVGGIDELYAAILDLEKALNATQGAADERTGAG